METQYRPNKNVHFSLFKWVNYKMSYTKAMYIQKYTTRIFTNYIQYMLIA